MASSTNFPGDDIARLIPENVRSILEDLKEAPIDHTKWLYANPIKEIYQGDVLKKVVVYFMDPDGQVEPIERPAIVMSHTCDCQLGQSDYVMVAPLFALSELTTDEEFTKEDLETFIRDFKENRLKDKLYLPKVKELPDSWLDFNLVFSISTQHFHSNAFSGSRERIISLSQKGHYFFLMRLSFSLGRPDPTDSKRNVS